MFSFGPFPSAGAVPLPHGAAAAPRQAHGWASVAPPAEAGSASLTHNAALASGASSSLPGAGAATDQPRRQRIGGTGGACCGADEVFAVRDTRGVWVEASVGEQVIVVSPGRARRIAQRLRIAADRAEGWR